MKDYLGSVRSVVDAAGNLVQGTDYYSGGFPMYPLGAPMNTEERLHTGKEFNGFNGFNCYDNKARTNDPLGTRFWQIDPLAEMYPHLSPYVSCANNPLKFVDLDGRWFWSAVSVGVDYGFQVYDNYQQGFTGSDAWAGNINFVSLGLSIIPGGGLFKTAAIETTRETVRITPNKGIEIETDAEKIATNAVVNTAVSVGTNKLTDVASNSSLTNANKEVSTSAKQLKTAERQALRSPNSVKKAENVSAAMTKLNAAKNNQLLTQRLNSTIGKLPADAISTATGTTSDRLLKNYNNENNQK